MCLVPRHSIHVKTKPVIISHSNAPPISMIRQFHRAHHLRDPAATESTLLQRRHAVSLSILWSGVLSMPNGVAKRPALRI